MITGKLGASQERYWRRMDRRYEPLRYTTMAKITGVTKDSSGRVTAATATIDGATGQRVIVPHGAALGVGSVIGVTNVGFAAMPVWEMGRAQQGTPGGAVMLIVGPDGQPYITGAGLSLGEANLLRNGDFSQTHRLHLNQPIGWIANGLTQIIDELGET